MNELPSELISLSSFYFRMSSANLIYSGNHSIPTNEKKMFISRNNCV